MILELIDINQIIQQSNLRYFNLIICDKMLGLNEAVLYESQNIGKAEIKISFTFLLYPSRLIFHLSGFQRSQDIFHHL